MRGRKSPYAIYPSDTAAERKARVTASMNRLNRKTDQLMNPVRISGRKLAQTWWGQAWNSNLEQYADYSNRIGRGRSYVREGAVLDLRITTGQVSALVQGSRRTPYQISISIDPLPEKTWQSIVSACAGQIASLQDLLEGRFPESLAGLFTTKGKGFFPAPREIRFSCSCPDWAAMCKHVAASLYGVGARLDEDPTLFFTLRGVDINHLISKTIDQKAAEISRAKPARSGRVLADIDVSGLFGVEMTEEPVPVPSKTRVAVDKSQPATEPDKKSTTKPCSRIEQRSEREGAVLALLEENGMLTRKEIETKLQLTQSEAVYLLRQMVDQRLISIKAHTWPHGYQKRKARSRK